MASQFCRVAVAISGLLATPCLGFAQDITPPPTSQSAQQRADSAEQRAQQAAQAARPDKAQLELRGKVADVWEAEVRSKDDENKVVLIETDQGQLVLAELGPADKVSVDEGADALVIGQIMSVGGAKRFVPQAVKVGKNAPAPGVGAKESDHAKHSKQPERQRVSGKVVDEEKLSAKESKIKHQVVVLEVTPEQRILVDLGPSDQLKALEIDENDKLVIDGQAIEVNESYLLVADNVQKGNKKVRVQRQAVPTGKAAKKARNFSPTLESE